VHVVHAYQAKLIWQARSKTDPIDARKLAELLRVNLLPTIWVPDAETRERRQLLRGRAFLVRQRTAVKNRIHGHLSAENHVCALTDAYGRAGRAWLATVPLSPMLRVQVDHLLRLHDFLTAEIRELDTQVKRYAHREPRVAQLATYSWRRDIRSAVPPLGDRYDHAVSVESGACGLRRARPDHAEFRRQDCAWRCGTRKQSLAQVDPRRDRADAEAGTWARRLALPASAACEG